MAKNVGTWIIVGCLCGVASVAYLGVFAVPSTAASSASDAKQGTQFVIQGVVTNSVTGDPVEGVYIQLATAAKALAAAYTDASGAFAFPNADFPDCVRDEGPYDLAFTKLEYNGSVLTGETAPDTALHISLDPLPVTKPKPPLTRSGPKSVYAEWAPNPEFNVKGYNVWRTQTDETGGTVIAGPTQVNTEIVTNIEYNDGAGLQPGEFYVYQLEAIGGAGNLSPRSDPSSPPVKSDFLTVYFPKVESRGLYLWEHPTAKQTENRVRIPVSAKCAYDVWANAMNIRAYLPKALVDAAGPGDVEMETTGITAGMAFAVNLVDPGDDVDPNDENLEFLISLASGQPRYLYGAGDLLQIVAKTKPVGATTCGDLTFLGDEPPIAGTRLYDENLQRLQVDLVDGTLCVANPTCVHGDVNGDTAIDAKDADTILALWVEKEQPTECSNISGDINLDGYVDTADATMILRWLAGMPINPSVATKAGGDLASLSFVAAAQQAVLKQDDKVTAEIGYMVGDPGGVVDVPVILTVPDSLMSVSGIPLASFTMSVAYPTGANGLELQDALLGPNLDTYFTLEKNSGSDPERPGYGWTKIAVMGKQTLGELGKQTQVTLVNLRFRVGAEFNGWSPIILTSFNQSDAFGFTPRHNAPLAPERKSGSVGKVCGTVQVFLSDSATQAPILNGSVTLTPGAFAPITQNKQGVYVIPCVSAGNYAIRVTAPGYATTTKNVTVSAGKIAMSSVSMTACTSCGGEGEGEGNPPPPNCFGGSLDKAGAAGPGGDAAVLAVCAAMLLIFASKRLRRRAAAR